MQSNIKRLFSLALALIMVLSCVPVMAFAAEDTASATYAAENTTTGVQYADLNEAITAAQAGQIVQVLADSAESVVYNNEGVILDLNGHDLSNVTVPAEVTLSAIDSATDDYEGSFGTLTGTVEGQIAATVKTSGEVKSYVTVTENGSYSFHRYYAAIAAISLKPAQAALGYRAEFRGDEVVKNAVVGYGYELWLNGGAHKAYSRTDALENSSLTLRLKNILAEGNDSLNALGSTATIGGNAFITLNLGGEEVTLYGTEQETTLRQVVESVNANVASYGEAQLEPVRTMCTTYAAWMEGWATDAIFGLGNAPEVDGDLKVEITVDVTAENNVLTQDATLSNEDISVTVPQGTVLEDGTTQLVLTITEKASTDSNVSEEEGYTLLPLDVHIQGISADNTTPIIVCLGEVLPKGLNIGNYELYHVESGETVAMTRVYSVEELDTHNEFYYDPATGAVTVAMASFSEITLRSTAATWNGSVDHSWYNTTDTTLYIYNADQLWSFSQIVGGMAKNEEGNAIAQDSFADKTVILYADIDLNDAETNNQAHIFYPIGYYNDEETYEKSGIAISSWFNPFKGTFDGNGHTIANFYQNTWEMKGDHNWYDATEQNYRDGMGLFGKVYGGTVKNLTVKNFSSDGEIATTGTIAAYADCGATFENITIFNCNPRVYNIGNGGIVGCVGWYNNEETDENPVTFKNITVDNTNKISALWGSWDVACGGLVGQYYPTSGQDNATDNAGIYMENCHVAAQIDVNNDVCANYQYYAYRYAGMLVGSVRENIQGDGSELYPDTGRVYPNMDGITASNCTVHYGTWNDYYYCELVANSQASYTHDYQFSRLTQVAKVNGTTITYLDGTTGTVPASGRYNYVVVDGEHATENATCYHFVDGAAWDHATAGKEDLDGDGVAETLIENNQHIYLEFYDQLVTGYGWGVTSMGIADMDGVTVLDREVADSVVKFDKAVADGSTYWTGTEVSISDLFTANSQTGVLINNQNVQVSVSPVGTTSTAGATYTPADIWTEGTLTFSGKGAAEIIITDYYFCVETRLEVYVDGYTVRYNDPNGITTVIYGENGITELPVGTVVDGMTFYGWSTEEVDDKSTSAAIISAGYKPSEKDIFLYAVYTYSEMSEGSTSYEKFTGTISEGDYLIVYDNGAMNTTVSSSRLGFGTVTISNNKITSTVSNEIIWHIAPSGDYWTLYNAAANQYAASTGAKNKAQMLDSGTDDKSLWTVSGSDTYEFVNKQNTANDVNANLRKNDTYGFATYSTSTGGALTLYKATTTAGEQTDYYVTKVTECGHTNTVTDTKAATCTVVGYTTVTCADCGATISTVEIPALGHSFDENGVCTNPGCNATQPKAYEKVTETLADWSGTYLIVYEEGNVAFNGGLETLDATNNTVAVEIVDNTIEATDAANAAVFTIKKIDGGYTIQSASGYYIGMSSTSNGLKSSKDTAYVNEISMESGNAVIKSSGYSMYLKFNATSGQNRFRYYGSGQQNISLYRIETCAHANKTTENVAATCTTDGYTRVTCNDCGYIVSEEVTQTAFGHSYNSENICTDCGEAKPTSKTYTFSEYTAGTQYAEEEVHVLDDTVTVTTTQCHFTTQLRIYSSSTYDGYAIIASQKAVVKIGVNAGYNSDELVVYGSDDGATWNEVGRISVTSSYADYELEFEGSYKYLKLDVSGTEQVRIQSMTLYFAEEE